LEFRSSLKASEFMNWEDTTTWAITFRGLKRKRNQRIVESTHQVPAVCHRLVCQLVAEDKHGEAHNSHESRHRQMYARKVLVDFVIELQKNRAMPLEQRVPPASFRSHTLTPILQRQLRGVHDAYMPSVHIAMIRKGEADLTISRATELYLHQDPTLAHLAPQYRHHLLYVPEPRWHLGVVLHPGWLGDANFYNAVRDHHEEILMGVREDRASDKEHVICDPHGMPILRRAEVRAILLEGLEEFFAQELSAVVIHPTPPHHCSSTDCHPCNATYWRR